DGLRTGVRRLAYLRRETETPAMRLPRVRLTVRRLMAAVAVVAAYLASYRASVYPNPYQNSARMPPPRPRSPSRPGPSPPRPPRPRTHTGPSPWPSTPKRSAPRRRPTPAG